MRCGTCASRLQRSIGAGESVEAGRDHQLQVALGENDVGVLPVQHLALLGDAKFAVEAVDRLREDGAMRGAAAAAYRSAAAVEEAQSHAALASDLVERAMSLVDLPRAGDHAAVLVGVGVAEHDLLLVVPGFEKRLVRLAGPQLAHDRGCVLQVFDRLEERDRLQTGIVAVRFDLDSAEAGKPEHVKDVFSAGGSADDVLADGLGRVRLLELCDGAEGVEDLGRLFGESRRKRQC